MRRRILLLNPEIPALPGVQKALEALAAIHIYNKANSADGAIST
mgnify:CR=1 FL=1